MISFICSAYNRPQHLKGLAYSLIVQTNTDWELLVMDESEERINDISNLDKRIRYFSCDVFNDYGYSVKEQGIQHAKGEFLCFPADDVYYAPAFVEIMSKNLNDNDLVYCNWIFNMRDYSLMSAAPVVGSIDIGGFVVKKELMSEGFKNKSEIGDGVLVTELCQRCRHSLVNQVLYVKN